ncbi:NAD(P)H-hydrate dehydratase [Sphingoaurantiacus capsulatus]|uniref:Bifunctional NAD(P)H-hydrate repair enzyme n=1 Tax=Sphingoaurantiacus capsulatus TaxID=1771310 RepID=A0ABV7XCP1_9SPHN
MPDSSPLTGGHRPIVTAAEMRALEAAAIAQGVSEFELMARAGHAAARAIIAYAAPADTLVLCGPGNNGGDGYVIALALAEAGWPVRVAALAPSGTDTARQAAEGWTGPVETLDKATAPASLLVDALFGIGLTRPLDGRLSAILARLGEGAGTRVAIDLPSGVATDDGACLSPPLACDLCISFGAAKPAHYLHPAAAHVGRLVIAPIGLAPAHSDLTVIGKPRFAALDADTHKYRRGHVLVVGGPAHATGAARLAALAAQRAGAGYVTLLSPSAALAANAAQLTGVVLAEADTPRDIAKALAEPRAGALVIGPALGPERHKVIAALEVGKPVVLDADVFTLFANDAAGLAKLIAGPAVLTPHDGEFVRLFGDLPGSKVERVCAAAARIGAVVLLKGPDTVIAAPDGRAAINAHASSALATAGSGDVLAGIIGALLARGLDPFEAACAGAWLHGDAGQRGGAGLIAEDLPGLLPAVLADLA